MHEEQSSRGFPPHNALRLLHGEWAFNTVGEAAEQDRGDQVVTGRPGDHAIYFRRAVRGCGASWPRSVRCPRPPSSPSPAQLLVTLRDPSHLSPPWRCSPASQAGGVAALCAPASFLLTPLAALSLFFDNVSGAAVHRSPPEPVREGGHSTHLSTPSEQHSTWTEGASAVCAG